MSAALRTFRVSLIARYDAVEMGTAQARDAADAVRVAHGLARRPSLGHGPYGSGYVVRGRYYLATEVGAQPAPAVCPVCHETHELIPSDSAPDERGPVTPAEAQGTAHYRLEVMARSAAPFRLHGRRAQVSL